MVSRFRTDIKDLYRRAWQDLRRLRVSCPEVEPESTPVLAFGRFDKARVITAGLNPSEDEFLAPANGRVKTPLLGSRQRFLHWPDDGRLTDARLNEALRRATGYFELGNDYEWFNRYGEFLEALRTPFKTGLACHTDYVSPFTTIKGISKCKEAQKAFREIGTHYWTEVLELCPRAQVLFGHGRGWHLIEEENLLGISKWHNISTPFDQKGDLRYRDRLKFAAGALPKSGRKLLVYWWCPNRDGSPLCYLNASERRAIGTVVRRHVARRGIAL